MAIERKLMTAEELQHLPDDGLRHELVNGELVTMPPVGFEHGDISALIGTSLRAHVEAEALGRVVVGEVGFRLTTDPDTVRAPDVAFVRTDRLRELGRVQGYFPGAPDLLVEVIPPTDLYTEVDEKVAEWLQHGTRLVFVVNPRRRTVAIHHPGQTVHILTEDDALAGEDVVPGWSLAIRDLFR